MSGTSDRNNGSGTGQTNQETEKDFLVVGLGASAGGIKALKEFFERVAPDSGMVYVVILHLSPDRDSKLAEILQQVAPIPVTQVTGRVRVEPNNVYVIPPNKSLAMMDGHLALSEITRVEERCAPVDIFFRTLAESHDSRAVSVVLSGTGANGSMGMKRVKERGGVCFVQDPQEAEYSDMPRHSIATNLVDAVLPVAEIPARIVAYKEILGQVRFPAKAIDPPATDEGALRESEARLRAMFEQANVGIVQASFDGRLLVVNPGFCKVIGYAEDELLRMAIHDFTQPDDYETEEALTSRLIAGEIRGYSLEKRVVHKDGRLIWVNMTATLVECASDESFCVLSVVEDINERKLAEEALLRAHEGLEDNVRERTLELAEANIALQTEIVERKQSESARVQLLRQLVTTQEDERRRIARDLHDHLGQQLTALRLKIAALKEGCGKNKSLRERVEEIQSLAGQLDSDVDFLAWELRPAALDDLGLTMALGNYVQEWSHHFNTPAEFHTSNLDAARLPPEIETNLYRITQEALNNIYKHAHASRVDVILEQRDGQAVLIIEDDGDGFDLNKKEITDPTTKGSGDRGLGLTGMRERAALIGGTVQIESELGAGTTIFARIPISLAEV